MTAMLCANRLDRMRKRCEFGTLSLVLWGALASTACLSGGGGGQDPEAQRISACLSCGEAACPSEHAACQDVPACASLYDCSVRCAAGDAACQSDCTSGAGNDVEALSAATNYSACIATSCTNECAGDSTEVTTPDNGSTPTPSIPGESGATPSNPTPAGSGGTLCDQLYDWAVGCAVDTTPDFQTCSEAEDVEKCSINCLLDSSCGELEEVSAGVTNDLSACLTDCVGSLAPDVADPTPTQPAVGANGVGEGGYYTAGDWGGYAWTATDSASASTITPSDFDGLAAGSSLCVEGVVAATSDYSGVAILGINLNQPTGDPAPEPSTWLPTNSGIQYSITNTGESPLRIQIQAPGGDVNENARWCAPVVGSSGSIYWSDFNTACWDGSGSTYDGSGLEAVMVLVPGDQVSIPYSFCLNSLSPT